MKNHDGSKNSGIPNKEPIRQPACIRFSPSFYIWLDFRFEFLGDCIPSLHLKQGWGPSKIETVPRVFLANPKSFDASNYQDKGWLQLKKNAQVEQQTA